MERFSRPNLSYNTYKSYAKLPYIPYKYDRILSYIPYMYDRNQPDSRRTPECQRAVSGLRSGRGPRQRDTSPSPRHSWFTRLLVEGERAWVTVGCDNAVVGDRLSVVKKRHPAKGRPDGAPDDSVVVCLNLGYPNRREALAWPRIGTLCEGHRQRPQREPHSRPLRVLEWGTRFRRCGFTWAHRPVHMGG